MKNRLYQYFYRSVLYFGLTSILIATTAFAQTLSLAPPSILNEEGSLVAHYGVTVVEKPIFKGELQDGIEMTLRCSMELVEVNSYWLDSTLSTSEFSSSIRYDRIRNEFVLTLPNDERPLRNANLETILRNGWGSIKSRLGLWEILQKGHNYSLRLRTSLNEKGAPEGVNRLIYFWSLDTGTNNTFHLNFTF